MKRVLLSFAGLCAVALGLFLWLAPGIADHRFNTPRPHAPYPVSQQAQKMADDLPGVADLHVDTLLWKRNLLKENQRGHVDIPRALAGNMAINFFGVVTKAPRGQNYDSNSADSDQITLLVMAQLWPPRTWFSLKERALYQAQKLDRYARKSGGALMLV
ncbi:MAG: peptidase M19, partial [Pseudomonadota bacterium]